MMICEYEHYIQAAKAYEKFVQGVEGQWRQGHQKYWKEAHCLVPDRMDDIFEFRIEE